jgi:TRAP-type mannitol/chloroaromatic compound transport system permease small subunit
MRFAPGVIRSIDSLNRLVGWFAGLVALLMVLLVTADVIMRYLFNTSFVFVQEMEWHLFGVLFLAGAGYTLLVDGHVRVDVFYQKFGVKGRAWINLLGVLIFLIPGCILILDTSWNFFMQSLSIREGSPDPGGLPARYALKFFIPFGFAMVLLQGISLGLKSLLTIIGRPYQPEGEGGSKGGCPAAYEKTCAEKEGAS